LHDQAILNNTAVSDERYDILKMTTVTPLQKNLIAQ